MKSKKLKIFSILAIIISLILVSTTALLFFPSAKSNDNKGLLNSATIESQNWTQDSDNSQTLSISWTATWNDEVSPTTKVNYWLFEKRDDDPVHRPVTEKIERTGKTVTLVVNNTESADIKFDIKPYAEYSMCAKVGEQADQCDHDNKNIKPSSSVWVRWTPIASPRTTVLEALFSLTYWVPKTVTSFDVIVQKANDNTPKTKWEDTTIKNIVSNIKSSSSYYNQSLSLPNSGNDSLVGKFVRVKLDITYGTPAKKEQHYSKNIVQILHHTPKTSVKLDFDWNNGKKIKTGINDISSRPDIHITKVYYQLYWSNAEFDLATPIDGAFGEATKLTNFDFTFDSHTFQQRKWYEVKAKITYTRDGTNELEQDNVRSYRKLSYIDNNLIEKAEIKNTSTHEKKQIHVRIFLKQNVKISKIEYQKQWSNDGETDWQEEGSFQEGNGSALIWDKHFNDIKKDQVYYRVIAKIWLNTFVYQQYTLSSIYMDKLSQPLN